MVDKGKQEGINLVHDYDRRIRRHLIKLKEDKSYNSKKILEFHSFILERGLKKATQEKYLNKLVILLDWLKKDFNKVTKEDLKKLVETHLTSNQNISDNTRKDYKVALKKFFQWLKDCKDGEYPDEVSWMRCSVKDVGRLKQPEDLLDDKDIEEMIKAANHPRDKALIIILAESGCRISEILTLQIKNIIFDDRGTYFLVNGKTGTRRVRVVNSTPYLHAWLNIHPELNNPEAPLWVVVGSSKNISKIKINSDNFSEKLNRRGKHYKFDWSYNLTYAAARKIIINAARQAGINKPINPHNFRHSRATLLGANGLNESVMNQIMGWKQGSRMAGVYIHLSGKQTDDALLPALYGMKVEEQKEKHPKMFPIKCINCGELNPYDAKRCNKCNNIIGVINKQDIEENSAVIQMSKILGSLVNKDGDLKKEIIEDLKKEILNEIKAGKKK